jgi:hypothetical protein
MRFRIPFPNGFLLIVPALVWNALLYSRLPAGIFHSEAPLWIIVPENILRVAVFALPLILPVRKHLAGWGLYLGGMLLYFASWLVLMDDPALADSQVWRLAPACLPLLWIWGIAWLGRAWWYAAIGTLFIGFHLAEYLW